LRNTKIKTKLKIRCGALLRRFCELAHDRFHSPPFLSVVDIFLDLLSMISNWPPSVRCAKVELCATSHGFKVFASEKSLHETSLLCFSSWMPVLDPWADIYSLRSTEHLRQSAIKRLNDDPIRSSFSSCSSFRKRISTNKNNKVSINVKQHPLEEKTTVLHIPVLSSIIFNWNHSVMICPSLSSLYSFKYDNKVTITNTIELFVLFFEWESKEERETLKKLKKIEF